MTGSSQHQTTKSSTGTAGKFRSGSLHPKHIPSELVLAKLKAQPYGSREVTGAQIVYPGNGKHRYVETTCSACGVVRLTAVANLLTGKSKSCPCLRNVKNFSGENSVHRNEAAVVLGERYDAMVQRCRNPKSRYYPNYGGRGIELRFESRDAFIRWMLQNLPHETYRGLQIDRADNNGHYEPGNLRLVTAAQNQRNKRTSALAEYKGAQINAADMWRRLRMDYPEFRLSIHRTAKLAAAGVSWMGILRRKARGPYKSRTSTTS